MKVIASSSSSLDAVTPAAATRASTVTGEMNARDLEHPNLVKVHGVFNDDDDDNVCGNTLVVMEYVGKANLQTLMETHPERIDKSFTLRWVMKFYSLINGIFRLRKIFWILIAAKMAPFIQI